MDYDKTDIAAVYDSARDYDPEILRQWLNHVSIHLPEDGVSRIVDLGCGTGRFSEALSVHFDADVIGIDPSAKMLERACAKNARSNVVFKQASAEELPADDSSTDMVFMSMVFHHLATPEQTALECHRILRDGGYVCVRNVTIDAIETFPYLRFFRGVRALMEAQLVSRRRIESVFEGAGFDIVAHETVSHQVSPDWHSFADKLALRAYSFLVRLPDDDFHAGMTLLRAHAEHADSGEPLTEDVDYFLFQR